MSSNNETKSITAEEARQAAGRWAEAEFALKKIESDIKKKQSDVAAKYDEDIADHTLIQNDAKLLLMTYSEANREELLEGKAKSYELAGIKIGYKLKPASLTLRGKMTWDKVKANLKEMGAAGKKLLKRTETVDKTALKKAEPDVLKEAGVQLIQDEEFYVKL